MKIHALRVAAFRRFSQPVAIEDFAAGMNVLAGPNEMGKSTFFHALEAAFMTRHKVTGGALDAMRPFSGGEPIVEVDLSHDGKHWRMRKQFGRANAAILTDLNGSRVLARNAEAEELLGGLLGRTGELPGPLGLVWVKQQRTLHAPDPDTEAVSGKEKQRGERSALQDAIGHEVETAASGETFNRVRSLAAAALDVNLTPTRNAARKNGPLDLARRRRDETRVALDLAQRAAAASEQRLTAIAAAMSELVAISSPELTKVQQASLQRLEADIALEAGRRAEFDLARETLKAHVSEVENARQMLASERTRAERIATLEKQRELAETLETSIAALAQELNSDVAIPARIERLQVLRHTTDLAEAEMTAQASRVDIDILPGGAGRIHVDGAPLAGTMSREVPEQIEIAIKDHANIKVTSAGAARAAAARSRRDGAANEMAELLAAIGVTTFEQAFERAAERTRRVDELERTRARLSGLAPQGSAGLATEIERLKASEGPSADHKDLESLVRSREGAAQTAQARFDGIKASVLSDTDFRQLSQRLDVARSEAAATAREAARLSMLIENLKSEQAGADEEGRAGQVAELQGEFERQDTEVKRLEADGLALLLLARTLDGVEAKARDAYFEPVTRRLKPHLQEVFGSAELGFRNAFAVDGLTRAGQREDFAVLSDGTREQLSVLVRLSFAELLAARGMAVPLVLDDPLVYSDDARLARMCEVLGGASSHMQIIILTCRAAAFQPLTGRRVSVTSWQPDS